MPLVQARELVSAGLAEQRGADFRLISIEGHLRRGLDGSRVHKSEMDTNVCGCYAFSERPMLEGVSDESAGR